MRIALAVPQIEDEPEINLAAMVAMATEASKVGAEFIMFSEAAVTGLRNTGVPNYDLALGQPIPGPASKLLAQTAQKQAIWIAFGLFEHDDGLLYDTALLIDSSGEIHLRYRRIDPRWHHYHSKPAPRAIYAQGKDIPVVQTPLGQTVFLICGDLFNETCQLDLPKHNVNWLLVPMARCFYENKLSPEEWEQKERDVYAEKAKQFGVNMLLVNQLGDYEPDCPYFGGALVINHKGIILDEYPIQQSGMLITEINV